MRVCPVALAAVSLVHLLAQATGHHAAAGGTQMLLMPLLAAWLWTATTAPRGRLVSLVLVALGFSWLGDSVPRLLEGTPRFLAMLGAFLVAQLLYAAAFWPARRRSLLARPVLALPYFAVAVLITVACAPGAGFLIPAVAVYAATITAMAVLASGLGRLAAGGGALFVVSDALIALSAFGVLAIPGHSVWVMSTYIVAQLLLVLAVRCAADRTSSPAAAPGPRPPSRRPGN